MMKYYKLLKDLPTFKAGDRFVLADNGNLYLFDGEDERHWKSKVMAYHHRTLERFPNILEDWFERIEAPATTERGDRYFYIDSCGDVYSERWDDSYSDKHRAQIGNVFIKPGDAYAAVHQLETLKAFGKEEE